MLRRASIASILAAAALAVGGAAASGAATPDLGTLVLDASQVGKGYVIQRPAGGTGTAVPTLDLCELAYPSERKRAARAQVIYVPVTSGPGASNEVVRYGPGGAAQALHEIATAPGRCPDSPVTRNGTTVSYHVTRLTATGMPAGSVALSVDVTATAKGQTQRLQAVVVYLRHGDTLSGVYVYGDTAAARLALARRLAATSASRLARSVGGAVA